MDKLVTAVSSFGVLLVVAACGRAEEEPAARDLSLTSAAISIAPSDFALVPCAGVSPDAFCTILAAGGKRVLIGAPAGIGDGRVDGETVLPDIVLLPSLDPRGIEGLDEVRNRTWRAGRRSRLVVAGGLGTEDLVQGLNDAYALPDATAFLEVPAEGRDFASMLLAAREIGPGDIAFDTGDLVVASRDAGRGQLAYLATYGAREVLIAPCGSDIDRFDEIDGADMIVGCANGERGDDPDVHWPLDRPVFFNATNAQ